MDALATLVPGAAPDLWVGVGLGLLFTVLAGLLFAALLRWVVPVAREFAGDERDAPWCRRVRFGVLGLLLLTGPVVALHQQDLLGRDYARPMVAAYAFLAVLIATEIALAGLAGLVRRGGGSLPTLFRDILRLAACIVAVVVLLRTVFGIGDLGALLGASAVISIIVGLAVQDTLGSVFAGLFLELDRPFKVGDWVAAGDRVGRVVEINWRSTRLVTRGGDSISVPNAVMARSDVINYSAPSALHRVERSIGVSYADPPNRVKKIILDALAGADAVLAKPPPEVYLSEYQDSVVYTVAFWLRDFSKEHRIAEEVLTSIWYQFRRHGVHFAKDAVPAPAEPRPEAALGQAHAVLRRSGWFAALPDADLSRLAADATRATWAAGERVYARGEPADAAYLIVSGGVRVRQPGPSGREQEVARLVAGAAFGEEALIGETKRDATVVSLEDTETIRLDRPTFEPVAGEHPEIESSVRELARTHAEAWAEQARQAEERESAAGGAPAPAPRGVVGRWFDRVRRLFGSGEGETPEPGP